MIGFSKVRNLFNSLKPLKVFSNKCISERGWFIILSLGGLICTLLLAYGVKLILLIFK